MLFDGFRTKVLSRSLGEFSGPLEYFETLFWKALPSFMFFVDIIVFLFFSECYLYLDKHSFYSDLVAENVCLLVKNCAFLPRPVWLSG